MTAPVRYTAVIDALNGVIGRLQAVGADPDEIGAVFDAQKLLRQAAAEGQGSEAITALLKRGGALVGSASCEVMEIADARQRGDFFATHESLGLVLRTQQWLDRVYQRDGYLQPTATPTEPTPYQFDLVAHLRRQREFSQRTFGPGARTAGVLDHIRKELDEVAAEPTRAGHEPEAITAAIEAKQTKNEKRQWPDWRTAAPDKAITHVKPTEPTPPQPLLLTIDDRRETSGAIDVSPPAAPVKRCEEGEK